MREFEIELVADSGEEPDDYGFFPNPPIIVYAKNKVEALRKLDLPVGIRVKKIVSVGKVPKWVK